MQGVVEVMVDAARIGERNPVARRHVELFYARQNGYLTEKEMQRICFCDLEQQKKDGILRTGRYVPQSKASNVQQADSWREAGNQNAADGMWLEFLKEFGQAHGLVMSKKEAQWYMYIHEGIIGDEVAAYLRVYGDLAQSEPEAEPSVVNYL